MQGSSQVPSKAENNFQTERNVAVNLGQPGPGTGKIVIGFHSERSEHEKFMCYILYHIV